jgi:hypothetical protein
MPLLLPQQKKAAYYEDRYDDGRDCDLVALAHSPFVRIVSGISSINALLSLTSSGLGLERGGERRNGSRKP